MSKTKQMKTHWVADIFPLSQSDVDDLAEDIKANGQKLPIYTLADGSIVDGRNRWLACQKIGIEPMVAVVDGDDDELLTMAVSLNRKRRTMSAGQAACTAAEVIDRLPKGKAGRGKVHTEGFRAKLPTICRQFNASERYTNHCLTLLREDKEAFESIKSGVSKKSVDVIYQEHIQRVNERRRNEALIAEMRNEFPEIFDRYEAEEIDLKKAMELVAEQKRLIEEERLLHERKISNLRDLLLRMRWRNNADVSDDDFIEAVESIPESDLRKKDIKQEMLNAAEILARVARAGKTNK